MALALYRKYRPATFAEVVGQEHVTEPLRVALAAGRVNHAYLFSGPRGCGKTSSARILARSLNCVQGPTPDPCGECNSCRGLAPGGSGTVDVVELDAASHGGVDDTRELRDRAFFAPAESRYRVFIIDEAHMVTTQGFNALLKIVEEPPEHLIFVFATTEPDKVLPTIRSRTHHYPFRLIPPGTLRTLLEKICGDEGVEVEPAVYPLVIKAGGGSARDSLSVLDQLLAGAGPEGVTYDRAITLLGVTDVAMIDDMVDGLAAGDGSAVYATVDKVVEGGHDPRRFTSDLLERLRDLVLMSAVPDATERGLVNAPEDELTKMLAQVQQIGPATLSRYAEILHTGLIDMRGATAPRLLLELLCARMLLPAAVDSEAALLQRVEQLERRPAGAPVAGSAEPAAATKFQRPSQQRSEPAPEPVPAPVAAPVPAPAPVAAAPEPVPAPVVAAPKPPEPEPEPVVASDGVDALSLRRRWAELLNAVQGKSTQAMLMNATVQSVDGNTVVIAHTSAPLARRLAEPRNVDAISGALGTVLGGQWHVQCVHGEPAGGGPGAMAAPTKQRPPAPTRPSQASRPQAAPPAPVPQPAPPVDDDIPPAEPPDLDDEPVDPGPPPEPEPVAVEEPAVPEPDDSDEPPEVNEEVDRRDPADLLVRLLSDELGATPMEKKPVR